MSAEQHRLATDSEVQQNTLPAVPTEKITAAAALIGALAASSCCILPVALFALGISGAWIGHFTQLAPYQPYFIAATLAFIAGGYWLVYRASKVACAEGKACVRPLPNKFVKLALIVATVVVLAAVGFDYIAAYVLS